MEAKSLLALVLADPQVRALTLEEFARLVLAGRGPIVVPARPPKATSEEVLRALGEAKQGLRAEGLKSKIGKDPRLALDELLQTGRIKKKGERRATTYFRV